MAHPYLVMRYRLDGVITVVDAVNGGATLDQHLEAVKQVAVADRIVLTKTDLLDAPERRGRDAALSRACTPSIRPRRSSTPPPARRRRQRLLDCGLYDPDAQNSRRRRWLAEEAYAERTSHTIITTTTPNRHDERIRAFTLATDSADPGRQLRDVSRPGALAARPEPAAPQGHREARRDAGPAAGDPRRPARLASAGAARRWPDARPAHPHRADHPRPRTAARSRDLFDAFLGAPRPTSPTAPRSSTTRWCRSAASIVERLRTLATFGRSARCFAECAR